MRKLIVISLLFGAVSSLSVAATPDCQLKYKFSNRSGDSANGGQQLQLLPPLNSRGVARINNILVGCNSWTLSYDSEGFADIGINLMSAGVSFNILTLSIGPSAFVSFAGTINVGTNPLTSSTGGYLTASGYYPFVGVLATDSSGNGTPSGTGSINIVLNGWKSPNMLSQLRLKNVRKEGTK